MNKRLFSGFFALAFAAASIPVLTGSNASATDEPIIIDNILDLCHKVQESGSWFDDSGTCDAYTSNQTSAVLDYRRIIVTGNWVLKNLNLTFTQPNSPFYIISGSLTIEGGHYTSPNCVVWIQYRDGEYVPSSSVTINSGVFEASLESKYSYESPSPVCVISREYLSAEEAAEVAANYLPKGKRFSDITLRQSSASVEKLQAEEGLVHISKEEKETEIVKYLKTTIVEVVDSPVEEEPEVEPTPEETEPEPEESSEETPFIPKAPNTGIVK